MREDSRVNTTETLIGIGLLLGTCAILLSGILLVWFATLRENHAFWTNAGGYPVLLRDLVEWTFIPLLVTTAIVLLGVNMACFSKICGSLRFFIVETLLLLLCWGLLASSCFIAFKNNLLNIFNGNPVHRHEQTLPAPVDS